MIPIMLGDKQVGAGEITGQGLYRCVRCRCVFSAPGIYKVILHCGDKDIKLGTLYPSGGEFILNKTISARNIGEAEIRFSVQAPTQRKRFAPIYPDREFTFLPHLSDKKLVYENGVPGVYLTDSEE